MNLPASDISSRKHPVVIQGGMGVGVSDWRLARAVAQSGHLGVVSGTALAIVLCRRLQDGDTGGHMRGAMAKFPIPRIADEAIERYYRAGGRQPNTPYKRLPMYTIHPSRHLVEMTLIANFVEVALAKENHDGLVGVNFLEKLQLPNLPSLYGAMLAGVDYVLMGAGIPREIPGILDCLARHDPVEMTAHVADSPPDISHRLSFDPREYWGGKAPPPLKRPDFLAIISAASLATMMLRKATGKVDGFVIEGYCAGGHNAPPRGTLQLNDRGEPVYGAKDDVDLAQLRALGVPFWLAGGFAHPDKLKEALENGAQGIQVGTAFALCKESGLTESLKRQVLESILEGRLNVFTDPRASPTGFPFKVVQLPGTQSEESVYQRRRKVCDLGYLRQVYRCPDGAIGYRCSGEPVADYIAKGGKPEDTVGRKCLCNALAANVGIPQLQADGEIEKPLVTAGDSAGQLKDFLRLNNASYSASDVIKYLLKTPATFQSNDMRSGE